MSASDVPSDRLDWIDDELRDLHEHHLLRSLRTRTGAQGAEIAFDGRRLVNFGSNDYLGLAADERLREAAIAAFGDEGCGSGASPLITGRGAWHERLEQALAEFEEREAALLFPSGFAANSGVIPALAGEGDAILADAKNHASLIDGCRLARAKVHIYRHGDCDHLARLLADTGGARRRWIVTDGIFSMDGDVAPLHEIAELSERYGAMLLVDEAHGTGVLGTSGRGAAEHCGVDEAVTVKVGTLSKALGAAGGFVAGSRRLIDFLANRARSYVFSTAQPAAVAAAALAALKIVVDEPNRRRDLITRAAQLREELGALGWDVSGSQGPIIPLRVGTPALAMKLCATLMERGFFVPGIRPPTVPAGESLLRLSLSYAHTPKMLERLTAEFARLRDEFQA